MRAQMVTHSHWSDIPAERVTPLITRRFVNGDRVTVARFQLKRGGVVPRHSHDAEQVTCVLTGSLRFVMEGQELVAASGDVVQIPSRVEHEVHVVEDTEVIDVFSPVRQDWIDKTDDYFRRKG